LGTVRIIRRVITQGDDVGRGQEHGEQDNGISVAAGSVTHWSNAEDGGGGTHSPLADGGCNIV
jgi:hypothetical protein